MNPIQPDSIEQAIIAILALSEIKMSQDSTVEVSIKQVASGAWQAKHRYYEAEGEDIADALAGLYQAFYQVIAPEAKKLHDALAVPTPSWIVLGGEA